MSEFNITPKMCEALNLYIHTKEVNGAIYKLKWLMKHTLRCKKQDDIIKLTLMCTFQYAYIMALVVKIKSHIEDLGEMIHERLPTIEKANN